MNRKYKVSEIMEKRIIEISPEISIGKAMKIMKKKNVKYLSIVQDEIFKGIISIYTCEYFKSTLTRDGELGPNEMLRLKHHKVSEIMHTKLVKLVPNDSAYIASEIMKSIVFQVIPVIDKRRLVGILTPELILSITKEKVLSI